MARGTGKAIAGIITLIIGGTIYSINQKDVVNNFSEETGMTKNEAEQYIENIPDEELVSFEELGLSMIEDGEFILDIASEIDCINYYYEWETDKLSCGEGKSQLIKFGESEISLGKAYISLSYESASTKDINKAIDLIEIVNNNYSLEIIEELIDYADIDESIKTNLFNKALLQAALDSD